MAITYWHGSAAGDENNFGNLNNWSAGETPNAGDTLVFTADHNVSALSSMDRGTTAYSKLIIEEGFTAAIGTPSNVLKSGVTDIEYNGNGQGYFEVGASANVPVNGGSPAAGEVYAIHLTPNATGSIGNLSVSSGSIAICNQPGDSGAITAVNVSGGNLLLDAQITSISSLNQTGGVVETRKSIATVRVYNGRLLTSQSAAITTKMSVYNGTVTSSGTGTIADLLILGGSQSVVDFTKQGIARTVINLQQNGGVLKYDPNVITITTDADPDRAINRSVTDII